MGRMRDEELRAAFAAEAGRAQESLRARASEMTVRDFLSIMATAGAAPEPAYTRVRDAIGQEYTEAGHGWIVSWEAPGRGSKILNTPFRGLMLMPDATFRTFEAGHADPLPYGAAPSEFMEAMGIGSFMLRLGAPAPDPDFTGGMQLKSLAACARRYLDLVP